jgi:hypothetical protein
MNLACLPLTLRVNLDYAFFLAHLEQYQLLLCSSERPTAVFRFKDDIGSLANFDFVSEDELLHTTTSCSLDFTIRSGFSHVDSECPADTLTGGSSVLAFGYLLDVFTNFDVVGTGEIGIRPTDTGGGTGGDSRQSLPARSSSSRP